MGTQGTEKGPSIWTPTFVFLCIINLFQVMGQSMMMTIMPLYARSMGATETLIGIVVGAFAVTALLSRPFFTPAFDSFPKKKILFAAELVIALCSFLYGFATVIPNLLAVRMLHGLAMGCTGPLALALVSDNLPAAKLGSGISIFSMTHAISQALGPAFGVFLVSIIDFKWTFLVSGFSMVIASILVLMVKEKVRENRPKYRVSLKRCFALGAVPPAIITCLFSAANASIMSFIVIYGGLLSIPEITLYFTVHAVGLIVLRPIFGRLADRFGFAKVIIPSIFMYALAFFIISIADNLPMFLLAAIVAACGYGVCSPLFQAIAMGSVDRERSGAASSTNFTGLDSAQLIGPTFAGFLIEFFYEQTGNEIAAYQNMYRAEIVLVFIALLLFIALYKLMKKNMDDVKARAAQQEEK